MSVITKRGRGFLMIAGLVGSVLVAGCGGSSLAEDIAPLHRAADVTAATGVRMTISLKESVGGPSVAFQATGAFTPKKDQGTMMMTMESPAAGSGPATPMRVVIAKGTIYERLPQALASQIPGGKPWLSLKLSQLNTLNQLPGLYGFIKESLIFDDPRQYLDFLSAAAAGSVKKLGQARVNGVQTTRYQAAIDVSKLPAVTPSAKGQPAAQLVLGLTRSLHATVMPVDVYVDRKSLIRQLQTTLRGKYAGIAVSLKVTENITRYGSQPVPAVPSPANTTNLLSLVKGL